MQEFPPNLDGIEGYRCPASEKCPVCQAEMKESNRTENRMSNFIRVFWQCPECKKAKWETYYGAQAREERRVRWH